MIDLEKIRSEISSIPDLIHFNNAGTSLMAEPAYQAVLEYLELEQRIGGYEAAKLRSPDCENFYQQAANLINCDVDEIAYCESASRAWQMFFYSLQFKPGDKIITTQLDYGSNFVGFIQQSNRMGVEIVVVPMSDNGQLDLSRLRAEIDSRVKLISLSHIPTANGIINPAKEVGRIASEAGIPYLLDACQSVGQIQVDVNDIGCTALSATGRKYLRGPRGTGFLYVERSFANAMEPAMLDQHGVQLNSSSDFDLCEGALRFENFECSVANKIGLGVALQYANEIGLLNIEQRIINIGKYCRDRLESIGATVQDTGEHKGGIVMFTMPQHTPSQVQQYLAERRINVWVSSGPGSLVDYQARGIDLLIRASLHYFNTEQEIDLMIEHLQAIH